MENFKIDNWKRDNKIVDYMSLKTSEIEEKIQEISKICNISFDSINNNKFFTNILKVLNTHVVVPEINECNTFSQILLLMKDKISMETDIYLFWNYDSVDKMVLSCLAEYWDYIWYGTSDEMVLLFVPEKQLLLITDYGVVYFLTLCSM